MDRVPVNLELIRSKAADIRREVALLQRYVTLTEEDFVTNEEAVRASRYSLIVAVEAAATICSHLAARAGRAPDSYPGCFEILGEVGVIDSDLCRRLVSMARFRNLLVHAYARIDDRRLYRIIEEDLGDLELYLQAVKNYLDRRDGSQ